MIRVLIVDDSALMRNVLRDLLSSAPDISVVGEATNGLAGLEKAESLKPDIITMDLDMPIMDGVTATKRIMAEHPVPVLVFSASAETRAGFAALEAGARDVLLKPDIDKLNDEVFRRSFCEKVRVIARSASRLSLPRTDAVLQSASIGRSPAGALANGIGAVVIGASTGGPVAVHQVLSSLPADFPVGIALVQHLEDGFDAGYAQWLGEGCKLKVRLAGKAPTAFEAGTVIVAPVNKHLVVNAGSMMLDDGARVVNQKPAVDVLFRTASAWFGPRLVGVLLTGMGRDGADGCKAIVDASGRTLVQDKETSAIYGMPKAAAELGAATEVLPLAAIGPRLVELVQRVGR